MEIDILSPASAYAVAPEKISETVTDDEGNVLIEAVAYYPVIENPTENPYCDTINSDYKWDADKFIEEAKAKKEDALMLKEQMGDAFTPFVFELTYEQTYSIWGHLSFTNHKYINVGGAHPSKIMESRTYSVGGDVEMSVSEIIDEDVLEVSLAEYVTNLFVEKLKEIAPESADVYTISAPVSICSLPSLSIISVPLALQLPITFLPVLDSSSSINSLGNPVSVNVLKGIKVLIPINSK